MGWVLHEMKETLPELVWVIENAFETAKYQVAIIPQHDYESNSS